MRCIRDRGHMADHGFKPTANHEHTRNSDGALQYLGLDLIIFASMRQILRNLEQFPTSQLAFSNDTL